MGRKWILLVFLLLNCLLLGSCRGESDKDSGAESGNSSTAESGNGFGVEPGNGSGNISTVSAGEEMLYIKEIRSFHFEEPEEGYKAGYPSYDFMDGKVYQFRAEFRLDETGNFLGSDRMCVQIYDIGTQKMKQHILTPEVPGYEEYRIISEGLTPDGEISLELKTGDSCILVKTDLQGTVLEVADPFPNEALYPWNMNPLFGSNVFHLTNGRTIISRWDEAAQASILTWFGGENSGQALGRLDGEIPSAFCSGEEGILFCVAGDSLFRWDMETNDMEELFRLHENGVEIGISSCLIPAGEGEFLLCRMNEGGALVYVLTNQEPESDVKIRLSCVNAPYGVDYILKRARSFARDTGSIPIAVEKVSEKYQDDYRNRIFAELAAGKGPEIMWLSGDDLHLLAEKGLLCDMSGMIPEDIKEKLIPAALELGNVDGKMVGFTPQVDFLTLITADRTWVEEGWDLSDFKGLAETAEDLEVLVTYMNTNLPANTLFFWIFMRDVDNSPFLDLEQGISHFDSEEFIQILELCKKYGHKDVQMDTDERVSLLKEGKIAAAYTYIANLSHFSSIMEQYGQDCHIVGIPTKSGCGNYVTAVSDRYLAVNINAEHKEEIAEFIAYLLDYDYQYTVTSTDCSVRMDVIRDSVLYDEWKGYRVRISSNPDNLNVMALTVKPDGTTWLEEFLDFLENCEPEPFMPEQIRTIIAEELDAYFEGDRSAGDVANIIHNRVQLYLDENSL